MLDDFWWPRPADADGPDDDTIERNSPATMRRMRVSLGLDVRPPWLSEDAVEVVLPLKSAHRLRGDVLAEAEYGGARWPLMARNDRGVVFAFDPHRALHRLVFGRALSARRPLWTYLPFDYHRIPPAGRLALARVLGIVSATPRAAGRTLWPIDPSVEILRWLWYRARTLEDGVEAPVPFWPDGRQYALTLTHDIDTPLGQHHAASFAALEEAEGFRSCWYVVGRDYAADSALLKALCAAGHEIGLHADAHDNTLAFVRPDEIRRRLGTCDDVVRRFAMQGFRSPSFFRSRRLLEAVAERFAYDSSIPDTTSFPAGGGCRTVFPLWVAGVLVMPATVPPDGSLLIAGLDPEAILELWWRKIQWIRAVGGVAVVLTHPEPHMSAGREMMEAYRALLRRLRDERQAWVALPREIAAHWRRRACGGGWSPASTS